MSRVRRIAAHELRLMARGRVSLIALGLLLLLALVARLTSAAQRDADAALRQRLIRQPEQRTRHSQQPSALAENP